METSATIRAYEEPTAVQGRKAIRIVRHGRKHRKLDRLLIFLFPKVFMRWGDSHLGAAHEFGYLPNDLMFAIDAQMKGDLKQPGFMHLNV